MALAPNQSIPGAATAHGPHAPAGGVHQGTHVRATHGHGIGFGRGASAGEALYASGSGSGSGSGSNSGSQSPPPPAISSLSTTTPGKYTAPDLPVGAYAGFLVMSPGGNWSIDPTTIKWSGGTNYESYFDDDADATVQGSPWLQSVQLVQGVATDQDTYLFIVGAKQEQYTITVNCSYFGQKKGDPDIPAPPTTVTFNSVRQTMANISGSGGFQSFYTKGTQAVLTYSGNNQPWTYGSVFGNVISAWTQTRTFGGDFMLLQLEYFRQSWTDSTGVSTHLSNAGGGENLDNGLDNGGLGADVPIGMALDPPNSGDGWTLAASSVPTLTETSDWPTFTRPISAKYM